MLDVETLILAGSYGAIFLLMIANGAASFPSSQLLYILVGYFVAQGTLSPVPALTVGVLGNTIGNILLYEFSRRFGRLAVLRWRLFEPTMLAKVERAVQVKGFWFLFIGKLLPAIKVFVPIPAGLGKMHRGGFAGIMFIASAIWASVFIAIGYSFGKSFHIFGWYGATLMLIAAIIVWLFLRYVERIELSGSDESVRKPSENIKDEGSNTNINS